MAHVAILVSERLSDGLQERACPTPLILCPTAELHRHLLLHLRQLGALAGTELDETCDRPLRGDGQVSHKPKHQPPQGPERPDGFAKRKILSLRTAINLTPVCSGTIRTAEADIAVRA